MRYNSIVYNDTVNGKGMRISFFTQGCSHHCKDCFNKELGWDFDGGKKLTKEVVDNMFFVFETYGKYYDGLSILGGEPLDNIEVTTLLINKFRTMFGNTKDIWIWSGYTFEEILKDENKLKIIKECDVLIDGRFEKDLKDLKLKYRGSSNQRIINIQESLKQNKVIECDWSDN